MPVIQSTRWCFTIPEAYMSWDDMPLHKDYKYMIVAKAETPKTVTEYIEGYVVFKKTQSYKACCDYLSYANWRIAEGTTEQNVERLKEDDVFTEYGIQPKSYRGLSKWSKERWADVIRSAKEGTCADEYPAAYLRYNAIIMKLYDPKLAHKTSTDL